MEWTADGRCAVAGKNLSGEGKWGDGKGMKMDGGGRIRYPEERLPTGIRGGQESTVDGIWRLRRLEPLEYKIVKNAILNLKKEEKKQ